jgi:hypothetical protein
MAASGAFRPDEIQDGRFKVRFSNTARILSTNKVLVVVIVVPGIGVDPDLVIGIGDNEFVARRRFRSRTPAHSPTRLGDSVKLNETTPTQSSHKASLRAL